MPFDLSSLWDTTLSLLAGVSLIINKNLILILIETNVNKQLTSEMWGHYLFF